MQKTKRVLTGTSKYILLMLFLIAVNMVLAYVLVSQSSKSMKELIDARMLDITNTAAAMIDGDILKWVSPADEGTPEYESVMRTLTYFQDNIELKYIYCVKDDGNKNFVFGLDPTPVDPGEFGSPVKYTDALYKASLGMPSVDEFPYEDEWGAFYSAYSPVFASDGTVAGIIAVDFSKEWYDAQISAQTRTVFIVNALLIAISGVLVILLRRMDLRRKLIQEQLAATSDIYLSMYEADLVNDTFTEIYNNRQTQKDVIGDVSKNAGKLIRSIYERYADPSSKERMLEFVDLSTLNERLKDSNTITNEFLTIEGKWRRARFIVYERAKDGTVLRVMYLVEDIDAEKRERDMTLETVKHMNAQISSVASIYSVMYEIDFEKDTISAIKTQGPDTEEVDPTPMENAHQIMHAVTEGHCHELSKSTMHAFVDFNTLNERLKGTKSIIEEFLSSEDEWCRARFIVSKRDDDGNVKNALWLVESIDEEKRRRDELAQTAQTLNYRISSIANIYMTAHELNISEDTFTTLKSDGRFITDVSSESRPHAQDAIRRAMSSLVDESYLDDVMQFVDLRTLEKRLGSDNTIAIEFMNREKQWRRGRFVSSRRSENGKLTHVLWLKEDINNEKKYRDQLVDMSEKAWAESKAKSTFLSNVSRELLGPVNAVLRINENIIGSTKENETLSYAGELREEGRNLKDLVSNIMDFSKLEAGKIEIVQRDYDLSILIDELTDNIKPLIDKKGLSFELDIDKNVPRFLKGDEEHLKQITENLLLNAVKFTDKGVVKLCVDYEKIPEDPDAVMLGISIVDTGVGIKKEELEKVFSEFENAEAEIDRSIEGTGLGMSLTKHLLSMMDSSLEVESIYGMGSKFSFALRQEVVKWELIG